MSCIPSEPIAPLPIQAFTSALPTRFHSVLIANRGNPTASVRATSGHLSYVLRPSLKFFGDSFTLLPQSKPRAASSNQRITERSAAVPLISLADRVVQNVDKPTLRHSPANGVPVAALYIRPRRLYLQLREPAFGPSMPHPTRRNADTLLTQSVCFHACVHCSDRRRFPRTP